MDVNVRGCFTKGEQAGEAIKKADAIASAFFTL